MPPPRFFSSLRASPGLRSTALVASLLLALSLLLLASRPAAAQGDDFPFGLERAGKNDLDPDDIDEDYDQGAPATRARRDL